MIVGIMVCVLILSVIVLFVALPIVITRICRNIHKQKPKSFKYNNCNKDSRNFGFEEVDTNGLKNWIGTVEIKVKYKHYIFAEADCMGLPFIISLSKCYIYENQFDDEEWCVCVPNWEISGKVSNLNKQSVYDLVHKYINDVTVCISCSNAILFLLQEANNDYFFNQIFSA